MNSSRKTYALDSTSIRAVRSVEDLKDASTLFAAYAASLGFDLVFQGFEAEVNSLPGKYALPGGEILLARDDKGMAVGCVAVRSMATQGFCEMKRLYILPEGRGLGLGKKLVNAIIEVATRLGYDWILLDTAPSMTEAIALYQSMGFTPTAPYYETPLAGTIFLSRQLQKFAKLNCR